LTEIPAPLITTTFYFFHKSDLKKAIAFASSPLNGCLISIFWKTSEGAGRMGFCDFTTRGYFFGGSCLRRGSLLLGVLRFDMVEDAI